MSGKEEEGKGIRSAQFCLPRKTKSIAFNVSRNIQVLFSSRFFFRKKKEEED